MSFSKLIKQILEDLRKKLNIRKRRGLMPTHMKRPHDRKDHDDWENEGGSLKD
jgi:hypothetical protein